MLPLSSARRLGFGGGGEADAGRSREAEEEEADLDEAKPAREGFSGRNLGRDGPTQLAQ